MKTKIDFVLDEKTKTTEIKLSCPNDLGCCNHMVFWVDESGEIKNVFGASLVLGNSKRFRCDRCGSEFVVKIPQQELSEPKKKK